MKALICSGLLALALVASAQAAIDTYTFKSEADREQFRQLTAELRCPKCQNQNIADSNAPIATDLRREIFRMLEEGKDNQQITDYLVARYGEFVRYRPSFGGTTLWLWLAPVLLLIAAIGVVAAALRSRSAANRESTALSAEEQARLQRLLDKTEQDT